MNGKRMFLITSDNPPITTPGQERVFRFPTDIIEVPEDAIVTNQKAMDDLAAESKDEGIEAAWELAREVYRMRYDTTDQLRAMYGANDATHVFGKPYEEVVKNREHWAKTFHVGDVVKLHWGGEDNRLAVVTWTKPGSELLGIVLDDGNVGDIVKNQCSKTGKTLNVASLLVELNGEEE